MRHEIQSLFFDMEHAAAGIQAFVMGKTYEDFEADLMLRSAVERQFEIIGEALSRLRKVDPTVADRISEHQRIIGFRNVLIHGYDAITNDITWRIIHEKLPILRRELKHLMNAP